MKAWLHAALTAVIFLAAFSGARADDAKPGDKVAAKWEDGFFYTGTVTAAAGETLDVLFDDGDKGRIASANVLRLGRGAEVNVGDHVLAPWRGGQMHPGTISAKADFSVTVKWDDGDAPMDVARDRVALLGGKASVNAEFAAGTAVAAKWGGDAYYIAKVTGFTDGGKYRVEYGDGDKGEVEARDMVRVSADRGIAVGARVLACWTGARMYPGVVTMRTQDRYTVKWDDGSQPSEVPREKIAPLSER